MIAVSRSSHTVYAYVNVNGYVNGEDTDSQEACGGT